MRLTVGGVVSTTTTCRTAALPALPRLSCASYLISYELVTVVSTSPLIFTAAVKSPSTRSDADAPGSS